MFSNTVGDAGYLPSGRFPVDRPAIFFDQVPFQAYDRALPIDNWGSLDAKGVPEEPDLRDEWLNLEFYGVHHTYWPTDRGRADRHERFGGNEEAHFSAPLLSYNAFAMTPHTRDYGSTPVFRACVDRDPDPEVYRSVASDVKTYRGLLHMGLDHIVGSSGGSVHTRPWSFCDGCDGDNEGTTLLPILKAIGVIHGGRGYAQEWLAIGSPHPRNLDTLDRDFTDKTNSDAGEPPGYGAYYASVTTLTQEQEPWTRRDPCMRWNQAQQRYELDTSDHDCMFQPPILEPPSDGFPPCAGDEPDDTCTGPPRIEVGTTTGVTSSAPAIGRGGMTDEEFVDDQAPAPIVPGSDAPGSEPPSREKYWEMLCHNSRYVWDPREPEQLVGWKPWHDKRTNAAIAYGITGSTTKFDDAHNDDARIGSFALVCGPWSSLPYTMNWRHLGTLGMTNPSPYESWMSGARVAYQKLYTFLIDTFEREAMSTSNEVLLRPPSLKMCPPNYMLRSMLTWEKGDSALSREIIGVHALNCVRSERNMEAGYSWEGGEFDELTVYLTPKVTSFLERSRHIYDWFISGSNPEAGTQPWGNSGPTVKTFGAMELDLRQRIGNPGDTLVSDDAVPAGAELREIGCHRLSDGTVTDDYVITGFVGKGTNGEMRDIIPLCVTRP